MSDFSVFCPLIHIEKESGHGAKCRSVSIGLLPVDSVVLVCREGAENIPDNFDIPASMAYALIDNDGDMASLERKAKDFALTENRKEVAALLAALSQSQSSSGT